MLSSPGDKAIGSHKDGPGSVKAIGGQEVVVVIATGQTWTNSIDIQGETRLPEALELRLPGLSFRAGEQDKMLAVEIEDGHGSSITGQPDMGRACTRTSRWFILK